MLRISTLSILLSLAAFALAFAGDKPADAPDGMVWINGGEFSMGAAVSGHGSHEMPMASNDAEPIHRVRVDGFWMDKTTVTNEQFAKFVQATEYVTIAERTPTKEEFPDRAAGKSCCGICCLHAAGSRGAAQQSLSMVELCERCELASSARTGERHQRKREISGGAHRISRRRSVCEMGGQTFTNRSGV